MTAKHPEPGHEAPVKANRLRRGLLTSCVWCGQAMRCASNGPAPGYRWEPVE